MIYRLLHVLYLSIATAALIYPLMKKAHVGKREQALNGLEK